MWGWEGLAEVFLWLFGSCAAEAHSVGVVLKFNLRVVVCGWQVQPCEPTDGGED
jgi:hypothetical protein